MIIFSNYKLIKTIVKAKYKVEKLITKKKIPFKFLNFFEELVSAVTKCFCLFLMKTKSCVWGMFVYYKAA